MGDPPFHLWCHRNTDKPALSRHVALPVLVTMSCCSDHGDPSACGVWRYQPGGVDRCSVVPTSGYPLTAWFQVLSAVISVWACAVSVSWFCKSKVRLE